MIRLERILVPVDGSPYSRYATELAVRIGHAYAAEIVLLHVVDDQLVAHLAPLEDDGEARVRGRLLEQGQAYLRDVARIAAEQGLPHREAIAEGDPCAVICETARQLGVNLIVMGKVGRRGTRRSLVGSVAHRVIESSELPVLIVTGPPAAPEPAPTDPSTAVS
jgi:nucleotide-binding universal stress UspA family protein